MRPALAAFTISASLLSAIPAAAQDIVQLPLFDGALIMRGEVGVTEDVREPDGAVLGFWRPVLFGPAEKPIGGRMDCRLGGLREDYSDALFDIESRYEASRDERERSGLDDQDTDYVEQDNIRRLEVTGRANNPHRHYVLTYLAMRDGRHLYDIRLNCEFKHLQDPGSDTDYAAIMHLYVDLAVPVPISLQTPLPGGEGLGEGRAASMAWRTPTQTLPRAGEGLLAARNGNLFGYSGEDAFGVRQNVIVPEPDDTVSGSFDVARAGQVSGIVRVLAAIQFNSEPELAAGEIDDVSSDGVLLREANSELVATQMPPEPLFRFGRLAPQLARGAGQSLFGHMPETPSQTLPLAGEGNMAARS